jgi:hypothetical protein
MRRSLFLLALLAAFGACSDGSSGADPGDPAPGAESPEAAVSELIEALAAGEFNDAVPLGVPGQAALAALAEGAAVADVAAALRESDSLIASNFWSGFAQSVGLWLTGAPVVAGSEQGEAEGIPFGLVSVQSGSGPERILMTRDVGGHRVDIFATFGPSLASRLYPQVERLLETPGEDASLVLAALQEQVPSLHMATQTPGLAPNVVQDILLLIELITRVS